MKLINHQFINEPFFLPDWEVKHLLNGTFNRKKISELECLLTITMVDKKIKLGNYYPTYSVVI